MLLVNTNSTVIYQTHYEKWNAARYLSEALHDALMEQATGKDLIYMGIGTDRSTGDCLGPLVGTFLKNLKPRGLRVYGTLEHPVHAVNLREYLHYIKFKYENPFIIAVDACLGHYRHIGMITIEKGPLKPGIGVGKKHLPEVGDISITSVVNAGGFMEYLIIQNTRLWHIFRMAEIITKTIYAAVDALAEKTEEKDEETEESVLV